MSDTEIQNYRTETPGCKNRIHFNNAGASLMPLPVVRVIQEHISLEAEIGGYEAANEKAKEISEFYSVAASFLWLQP